MDHELTTAEQRVLRGLMSAAKWDILIYDLVYLVPVSILIILSAFNGSMRGVLVGISTYAVIRLWATTSQCRQMPAFQSAVNKLMDASGLQLQVEVREVPEEAAK